MIERHLASPAPTFGTQYGHPGPAYNHQEAYSAGPAGYPDNHAGYGSSFQSYGPGQNMNMNNAAPSPIAASSAHPMFQPPAAYAQSPFSPVSPQYPAQDNFASPEATAYPAAYPVLTRQGSSHSAEEHHQPGSPSALERETAPANDYVDLSRSSVSPYQAAQYVEISRRLNTEVPAGLPTADIDRDLPPVPEKSPFADPGSAPPSPGGQYAIDRSYLELEPTSHRASGESSVSQTLEFPVPPSPAHTVTSRYRIDSMPPTLPEIHIESRVSVGNYPVIRNSGATMDGGLSPGLTTGTGSRFPTTPSPLASSFGFPSPAPEATTFPEATHPKLAPSPLSNSNTFHKKQGSMHSLYDAEDAYGGI
ncbi:hypothetical protein GALMADRAFT_1111913 [Galerina marginata CBS 339.88]|uniref:Uncharacterized protein n=1 Tax=Galerina marginata (strain CBS 339.88) TaxID=685588 RepID=A0A067TLS1_GALM3|nr:hypothetical protein GALMADRAFT_1111913 [Galerina marginata CBS 339.88]